MPFPAYKIYEEYYASKKEERADVCVDTCVLINFAIVARVDLLAQIPDLLFHPPQEVLNEITLAEQKRQVEAAVVSGGLNIARIEAVEELQAFAEYAGQFGRGESACLAIATCRKWVIATDETKDKRLSREISAKGIQRNSAQGYPSWGANRRGRWLA